MLRDKIEVLCNEKGISISQLENELNLGNGTVRKWNKANPSIANLKKVARYFNVSLDFLAV